MTLAEAVRAAIRASRAHLVEDEAGSSHLVSIEVPFNEWVDMARALKEERLPPREENHAATGGQRSRALGRPASPVTSGQGEGSSLRATGAAASSTREGASSLAPGRSAVPPHSAFCPNPAGRGGAAGLSFQGWQA